MKKNRFLLFILFAGLIFLTLPPDGFALTPQAKPKPKPVPARKKSVKSMKPSSPLPPKTWAPEEVEIPPKPKAPSKELIKGASPKLRYSLFFNWSGGIQNGTRPNGFELDRAYISLFDQIGPGANYNLTLDVARLDNTVLDAGRRSQNLFNFLKNAYIDLPLPELGMVGVSAKRARIGLQPNVWTGFVEDFWWYRFAAKTLADNEGIFQTADFGLGLSGEVNWVLLPKIDYLATLTNGGGFRSGETDSNKDISVRTSWNPFNLPLPGGYGDKGTVANATAALLGNVKGLSPRGTFDSARVGVLLALTNWYYGNLFGEYLYGGGGSATSVGGYYYLRTNDWAVFGRHDQNDPSRVVAGDGVTRNILGISYRWEKSLKYSLDIQTRSPEGGATESTLFFHVYMDPEMKMSY